MARRGDHPGRSCWAARCSASRRSGARPTAVAQLRRRLALTVTVLRDGRRRRSRPAQLVPGDVVQLSAGNLVPADGVVLEARDFLVSESSLTGESFPVEKQPGVLARRHAARRRTQLRVPRHLGAQRHRHACCSCAPAHAPRSAPSAARLARAPRRKPNSRAACGSSAYLLMRVMVLIVLVRADRQPAAGAAGGSNRCCSRSRWRWGCRPNCCRPS